MKNFRLLFAFIAAASGGGAAFADQFTVGGTEDQLTYPYCGCWGYSAMRSQDLVLQTDGLPAGTITRWEWYPSDHILAAHFYKFRVKLGHTSRTTLGNNYNDNYAGWPAAQVFYRDPVSITPVANEWFGFDLDTPFNYNGSANLIVEVWWEEDDEGYVNTYCDKITGRGVYSYVYYGVPQSGYPDAGELTNYLHYMRITMTGVGVEPSSLGRVKALYR